MMKGKSPSSAKKRGTAPSAASRSCDLNVIFQSLSSEDMECRAQSVLLSATDMKAHGIKHTAHYHHSYTDSNSISNTNSSSGTNSAKISNNENTNTSSSNTHTHIHNHTYSNNGGGGSSAYVYCSDGIVRSVYASKQQGAGVCVLHKAWTCNFDKNIKARSITIHPLPTSQRFEYCSRLCWRCSGTTERFSGDEDFMLYMRAVLDGVHFTKQISCQLTWKGKTLLLLSDPIVSSDAITTQQHDNEDFSVGMVYFIDFSTIFQFNTETTSSSTTTAQDNTIQITIPSNSASTTTTPTKQAVLQSSSPQQIITASVITPHPTIKQYSLVDMVNNIRKHFGGYRNIIEECVAEMLLAFDKNKNGRTTRRPRGLLISGASGTGKSKLMKLLVNEFRCSCHYIRHSILLSKYQGESQKELSKIFQDACSTNGPSCIIVDDIDLIFRDRSSCSDEQKRLVSSILTLLDGVSSSFNDNIFLIATSSRPHLMDSALRRPGRLDKEVELNVPSSIDRCEILKCLLSDMNMNMMMSGDNDNQSLLTNAGIDHVANIAHGMVGLDLELVIKEAYLQPFEEYKRSSMSRRDVDVDEVDGNTTTVQISDSTLLLALSKISPSALREVSIEVPNVHWVDIGGMDDVKQSLREVVEWPLLYPKLFESMGISPPKGVLLYGPPGCSKTLMAKALATESSMNFLAVRGPELLSKWLGESEKAIQNLFRRARAAAPTIIFFDEIDALTGKRGESSSGVNDRILSQLLTEIDGVHGMKSVIVIAATNRPDLMDLALLRPGRIDRKIYVGPPDDKSREQILSIQLRKVPVSDDINMPQLVEATRGFSGAEVVAVCSEAAYIAIESDSLCITNSHLLEVISTIKPQITPDMLNFYERLQANYRI